MLPGIEGVWPRRHVPLCRDVECRLPQIRIIVRNVVIGKRAPVIHLCAMFQEALQLRNVSGLVEMREEKALVAEPVQDVSESSARSVEV